MYAIQIEKRWLRELKKIDPSVMKKAFDLIESVIA